MKFICYPFLLFILLSSTTLGAQKIEQEDITFKHEIGTDITKLFEQIFRWEIDELFTPYQPIYYITYKYYFDRVGLRVAIGGLGNIEYSTSQLIDKKLKKTWVFFNYRIGIESQLKIGKKWTLSYGSDFRYALSGWSDDHRSTNSQWIRGNYYTNKNYGINPFLGLEYHLTPRIVLQTESHVFAFFNIIESGNTYISITDSPSLPMPAIFNDKTRTKGIRIHSPNFIVLAIKF